MGPLHTGHRVLHLRESLYDYPLARRRSLPQALRSPAAADALTPHGVCLRPRLDAGGRDAPRALREARGFPSSRLTMRDRVRLHPRDGQQREAEEAPRPRIAHQEPRLGPGCSGRRRQVRSRYRSRPTSPRCALPTHRTPPCMSQLRSAGAYSRRVTRSPSARALALLGRVTCINALLPPGRHRDPRGHPPSME